MLRSRHVLLSFGLLAVMSALSVAQAPPTQDTRETIVAIASSPSIDSVHVLTVVPDAQARPSRFKRFAIGAAIVSLKAASKTVETFTAVTRAATDHVDSSACSEPIGASQCVDYVTRKMNERTTSASQRTSPQIE